MATYKLFIEGYWADQNKNGLPKYSGIYFVYRCVYNPTLNHIDIKELIYIGKTEQEKGINSRIANHEKRDQFLRSCHEGETICYACAQLEEDDLAIVENAFVYAEQPPLNDKLKDHFNYGNVMINTTGYNDNLKHSYFCIKNDEIGDVELITNNLGQFW